MYLFESEGHRGLKSCVLTIDFESVGRLPNPLPGLRFGWDWSSLQFADNLGCLLQNRWNSCHFALMDGALLFFTRSHVVQVNGTSNIDSLTQQTEATFTEVTLTRTNKILQT